MDPRLKLELDGAAFKNVSNLIETVFPDDVLPRPASELLSRLSSSGRSLYNPKKQTWRTCPKLNTSSTPGVREHELADFFNSIGSAREKACVGYISKKDRPLKRKWTSKYSGGKGLPGVNATGTRYPDLVLLDSAQCILDQDGWGKVHAHSELKSNEAEAAHAAIQLTNGAYLVFESQADRRFTLGVSICGMKLSLLLFDRSGRVASEQFDIHQEPELLVRVSAGLTLTKFSAIGYDSTVQNIKGKRYLEAGGKIYELLDTVFISDVIRGRGTVCWHARRDGEDYAIKDMWADTSRDYSEAEILAKVEDVVGLPKVVWHGAVLENVIENSTARWRTTIDKKKTVHLETRVHRRIIMTPFAQPFNFFASKRELISMLIDIIRAHKRLVDRGILHRDISLRNMMRVPSYTPSKDLKSETSSSLDTSTTDVDVPHSIPLHRGLLIDLDYALVSTDDKERSLTVGHRTGTLPFMAADVLLRGQGCLHEPKHDLESVFYVLVWICALYDGPNDSERGDFSVYDTTLKSWLVGESAKTIGAYKYLFMTDSYFFESDVLALFSPYFEDLKPCVSALREALRSTTPITHEIMIDILQETFDLLPEIEEWTPKTVRGTSKRKLDRISEDEKRRSSKATSCPTNLPGRKPSKRMRSEDLDVDD